MPSARFVSAGGYHHHVGANTWHGRTVPAGESGISWFELVVPGEAALDAVRGRVTDGGHEVVETDVGFECVDPDGIAVRFRAGGKSIRPVSGTVPYPMSLSASTASVRV